MARRKRIILKRGKVNETARILNVGRATVQRALKWDGDTDTQNLIRKKVYEFGFVKMF